jgi:hypothetical protein
MIRLTFENLLDPSSTGSIEAPEVRVWGENLYIPQDDTWVRIAYSNAFGWFLSLEFKEKIPARCPCKIAIEAVYPSDEEERKEASHGSE